MRNGIVRGSGTEDDEQHNAMLPDGWGGCELRILPETSPQKGGGLGKQLDSSQQL
jgi:hypothetical protein